jgi:hypothetical protein
MPPFVLSASSNCALPLPPATSLAKGVPVLLGYTVTLVNVDGGPPPAVLSLGSHTFRLTLVGPQNALTTCDGVVTIADTEALQARFLACSTVIAKITAAAAGTYAAAFTTSYNGNNRKVKGCPVVAAVAAPTVRCDACSKPGTHYALACQTIADGPHLWITGSGGPGNYISWTVQASDGLPNTVPVAKECGVCVDNPLGKKQVCQKSWVPGLPAPC